MEKSFIITVDTEPDGQWDLKAAPTTHNVQFIPRFQELCHKYDFKPVYLTDYAMLDNQAFVEMMEEWSGRGECEIGMHLHAWDTPPFFELDKCINGRPYLIEYSYEDMEKKIATITDRLRTNFSSDVISHRAGRWALDNRYISLLSKYGYKIDCSVTPHIDWRSTRGSGLNSQGSNYTNCNETEYYLDDERNILEVPVTVRSINRVDTYKTSEKNIKAILRALIKGGQYWFRPALFSLTKMKMLYEYTKNDNYIEMMLHSSELMPEGSPYFKTPESIDRMYEALEDLFVLISSTHKGKTLQEFFQSKYNLNND